MGEISKLKVNEIEYNLKDSTSRSELEQINNSIKDLSESIQNIQSGADGVGIESVLQTTTSTEDSGTNVITVKKTDGTSSTFTVKNGSTGHTPVKGTDYFTDTDKTEIVNSVLEALPSAEGESY